MPLHLTPADIGKQFVRRDGSVATVKNFEAGSRYPVVDEYGRAFTDGGANLLFIETDFDLIHELGADMEPQVVCRDERTKEPIHKTTFADVVPNALFEFDRKIYRRLKDGKDKQAECVSDGRQYFTSFDDRTEVTLRPDLQLELVLKNK